MKLSSIKNPVAYLCSEFAIDNDLPTYAGGLGILAGDLINAAGTNHFPMIGIGLLYGGKQFIQQINHEGKERRKDSEFDHDTSFLRQTTVNGKLLKFTLPTPSKEVIVKAYHLRLSDTAIQFFLSTDLDDNPSEWVHDMDALYQGDEASQIRQEIILGVGGACLLRILNVTPRKYHFNEGRPIFAIWEITKGFMQDEDLSFSKAWEKAKEKIVYTNHTLVEAGNPTYSADAVRFWGKPFATELGVEVDEIIKPGLVGKDKFSITHFALNISNKRSAVSQVHGEYARKKYPEYNWTAITNGVYLPRWQDSDFRDPNISNEELWALHQKKKEELMETVVDRTGFGYDPKRLVISWARRLAEYKQPKAIFKDIKRLKNIIAKPSKEVQILFAGNSHSADPNAKYLIEDIIKLFGTELNGYAIFVPNYNISLANHLTSGSDVWLNTPKGNLEACGTSGMKAISNGVLNCTVLDGWTYEVDWKGIGWNIDPENVAEDFYDLLENEIIPQYYERNEAGLPLKWIERMKRSIELSSNFSAKKMLENYDKFLYS
ncbi:alpha-glucan family phosphorylase [Candidatus Woesebacteria bacterium]|nr:alpha-glucan family phosphorylase [Candidatus Woesebacteria bacterium]